MVLILYFLLFIIFVIAVIFSFPQFSPIPYFPSNKKDLKLIIKALQLRSNQTVFDLGAGDGMVIFAASQYAFEKKLKIQFVAVDINPVLLLIMHLRRLFHPNRKNIKIIRDNMFTMNYSFLHSPYSIHYTFYLYISPWFLEKTINNVIKNFKYFNIVSYMYKIPSLKRKEKIIKGKVHDIYTYNL